MVSGFAPHVIAHAVTVAADGTFGPRTFIDLKPSSDGNPVAVLSTAIGHLADGRTPVIAYGLSNGSVWLWDPAASTGTLKASATGTDPIDAVSFVDRVVGDAGAQDIVAVSSTGDSARVLRYDGNSTLRPQAVGPNGVSTTDVGGIRAWYPGYKAGRLEFRVATHEPVTVRFANRQQEAYGCWFAPAFPDSTGLPATGSINLPPSSLSGLYTIGGLTAAISGNCAPGTDAIGQWATYLVVNPTARPTDRTTIKLVIDRDGTASVRAVGGSLTASATSSQSPAGYALGKTRLTITGPADPVAPDTVTATVTQIDPAVPLAPGDGFTRPVYRIDIPSTAWTLPYANPQRLTARLAPLGVAGFNDAEIDDLGYWCRRVSRAGQPPRAASRWRRSASTGRTRRPVRSISVW